jgi:hypothetical protein
MENNNSNWPLKTGLFLTALAWFSFSFYEFILSIFHRGVVWPIIVTDVPSVIGLGFRTAAGFIAIVTILLYLTKKDLSGPETIMSLRWILLLEAAYSLSLIPSAALGFYSLLGHMGVPSLYGFIESTLPCLMIGIFIPICLMKLFFSLSPKKTARAAIKWALITGTFYLFVYWLNNMGNWIYTLGLEKGLTYITSYPLNMFSFILTTFGLLLIALYAAYFSKKTLCNKNLATVDLRQVGIIITALGLYFNLVYSLWLFFGAVGGWGSWYAWFFNHNMDLWLLALPFIGLPLLYQKKNST